MILSRSPSDVATVLDNVTALHAVPSTRCHTPICVFVQTDKSNVRQSLLLRSQQVNTNPQFDADGTLKRTPRDVLRAAFRVDAILNWDACFSSASAGRRARTCPERPGALALVPVLSADRTPSPRLHQGWRQIPDCGRRRHQRRLRKACCLAECETVCFESQCLISWWVTRSQSLLFTSF